MLIVVSGPSAVGKGTLCNIITDRIEKLSLSISATTRPARLGEIDGINYFFMAKQDFEQKIKKDDFLEWAKVYDNYYGTPASHVEQTLNQGKDVILEIDIQGAAQVKRRCPEGIFIFILPPGIDELRNRIVNRGTDSLESIELRMKSVYQELEAAFSYDYVVLNDDVEEAVKRLEHIIKAERYKASRNHDLIYTIKGGKQL